MNTEEIDRILRRHVRYFDGVFSTDTLPEKPRLLVCNTDASDKPGQHWICMHFEDGRGEYFDLFGQQPIANVERYLNRHCSSWTFNRRQLQSVISKFCGHYCIYYCMLRSRGIDMPKIVNSFTADTGTRICMSSRMTSLKLTANDIKLFKSCGVIDWTFVETYI